MLKSTEPLHLYLDRAGISSYRHEDDDRRLAAIHEAGHLVVARWCGICEVGAWIAPNEYADPIKEKSWHGQMCYEPRSFDRLSQLRRCMIGLAGGCAEVAWATRYVSDPEEREGRLYGNWLDEPDWISPTDWQVQGTIEPDHSRKAERALCRSFGLLIGELWQPLLLTARKLMRDGVAVQEDLPAARGLAVRMHLEIAKNRFLSRAAARRERRAKHAEAESRTVGNESTGLFSSSEAKGYAEQTRAG